MASEVYLKQTKKQRNTAWNRKAPLIFFQQERGWVSDTQSSGQDAASDLLLWDGSWLRLPHELRRSLQVHSKPASHCTVPGETNATPVTRSVPRELQGAQRRAEGAAGLRTRLKGLKGAVHPVRPSRRRVCRAAGRELVCSPSTMGRTRPERL